MNKCTRGLTVAGSISGLLAVALGAFAAHALKARLEPDLLTTFETGARYQMYHALALFVAAGAAMVAHENLAHWAGRCMLIGTVVFSGSLYALALTGTRWLGAITPFGGVLFIVGWGLLAASFLRGRR